MNAAVNHFMDLVKATISPDDHGGIRRAVPGPDGVRHAGATGASEPVGPVQSPGRGLGGRGASGKS